MAPLGTPRAGAMDTGTQALSADLCGTALESLPAGQAHRHTHDEPIQALVQDPGAAQPVPLVAARTHGSGSSDDPRGLGFRMATDRTGSLPIERRIIAHITKVSTVRTPGSANTMRWLTLARIVLY